MKRPAIIVCPKEPTTSLEDLMRIERMVKDYQDEKTDHLVLDRPADVFVLVGNNHYEKVGDPSKTKTLGPSPIAHCHAGPDYGPNAVPLKLKTEKKA